MILTILKFIPPIISIIIGLWIFIKLIIVMGDILSSEDTDIEVVCLAFGLFGSSLLIGLGVKLLINYIN